MTIQDIDVTQSLENARKHLKHAKDMSSETKALMELLILIVSLLVGKLNTNSSNSSIPPSKIPTGCSQTKEE